MSISEFLSQKPSLSMILEYIEQESHRIAKERQKQAGKAQP